MSIIKLIVNRKKGLVILVNKWDLVEKETNTAKEYEEQIKYKIAPFNDVPILFTSVLENKESTKPWRSPWRCTIIEPKKSKPRYSMMSCSMPLLSFHHQPIEGYLLKLNTSHNCRFIIQRLLFSVIIRVMSGLITKTSSKIN